MVPRVFVPQEAGEVSPGWVRRRLGHDVEVAAGEAVERIGEGFGLASVLMRVRLGGDLAPPSVVVKLWSTGAPTADREARLLTTFGDRLGARVPVCYDAVVDRENARAVLLLEDLGDVEQGDCLLQLGAVPASRVARLLARLHGSWWRSAELEAVAWLPDTPWLALDRGWFAPRRARFLQRFPHHLDEHGRELLDDLETVYAGALEQLAGAPQTLLHDDFHLDNIVFDRATGDPILLDWARAARGPAVLDLAELLLAIAEPHAREHVLAAYTAELARQGVPEPDIDALDICLTAAVVVSFVKATCGVARWEPASPREAQMIELGIDRVQQRGCIPGRHAAQLPSCD